MDKSCFWYYRFDFSKTWQCILQQVLQVPKPSFIVEWLRALAILAEDHDSQPTIIPVLGDPLPSSDFHRRQAYGTQTFILEKQSCS